MPDLIQLRGIIIDFPEKTFQCYTSENLVLVTNHQAHLTSGVGMKQYAFSYTCASHSQVSTSVELKAKRETTKLGGGGN